MAPRRDGFEISALVIFVAGSLLLLFHALKEFASGDTGEGVGRAGYLLEALAGAAQVGIAVAYLRQQPWAWHAILTFSAIYLAVFTWRVWINLNFYALVGIPVAAYVFYVIYESKRHPGTIGAG